MHTIEPKHPVAAHSNDSCTELSAALADILSQIAELLGRLTPEQYATAAGDIFANATIGGHVRHTLDHIAAIAPKASPIPAIGASVDYELRARGTLVEADPKAAQAEALRLRALFNQAPSSHADQVLSVRVLASRDGSLLTVNSTFAREMAFALSHTIHHCAILRIMLASSGIRTPAHFGFAPATLAHQDATQCAR
jgi:hypothetical protein